MAGGSKKEPQSLQAKAIGLLARREYSRAELRERLLAGGASRDDGLVLHDCRITNAVKCLPPANKPAPAEIRACNDYLAADLATMPDGGAILALGRIAHEATLKALRLPRLPFAHGARHGLERGRALFDSYHCSRYNTNTGRLTPAMFRAVFDAVARHLARRRRTASAAT